MYTGLVGMLKQSEQCSDYIAAQSLCSQYSVKSTYKQLVSSNSCLCIFIWDRRKYFNIAIYAFVLKKKTKKKKLIKYQMGANLTVCKVTVLGSGFSTTDSSSFSHAHQSCPTPVALTVGLHVT